MNESGLIANAEKFLDGIKHERINADEIPDFKTFMEIYRYLKDNLDKLQDLSYCKVVFWVTKFTSASNFLQGK
ncbi:MAG: DUF530 domain-containing protein [Methanobacterium paludis]|nr:DUF530 domain-containing protein [Methanobacterium paludis]